LQDFLLYIVETIQGSPDWLAYLAVFVILVVSGVGVPISEEIVVIAVGVAVHEGLLGLWGGWIVCYIGILVADSIVIYIGGHFGKAFLHRRWVKRLLHPRRLLHAHHQVHDHGPWVIIASRFIPGSRWPTLLIAGMMHMPYWKCILADGLAALVSVTAQLALGYYLAKLSRDLGLLERFTEISAWGGLAIGVGILLAYAVYRWSRRRRRGPHEPFRRRKRPDLLRSGRRRRTPESRSS